MTDQSGVAEAAPEDAPLIDNQADQQDTTAADAGADTVDAGEGNDAPKPRQTAQERINELTAARREAEREAEFWKSKAIPAKAPEAREQPAADDEPDPGDTDKYQFGETDPAYIRDLGAHAARQEFKRLSTEAAQSNSARTIREADADRRAAFSKTNPDFEDKVFKTNWSRTPVMIDAIEASENGPAVAYHLANNPDEAARIATLDPRAQILALGRIEGRLTPADPKPSAKTVTDAPVPAPQVRSANGAFAPTLRDDMPAEEWVKLRNAQVRGG